MAEDSKLFVNMDLTPSAKPMEMIINTENFQSYTQEI